MTTSTFASAAPASSIRQTKAGADYADVQFWTMRTEGLFVRNGDVRDASDVRSLGYGVRALVDGSWGFYGSGPAHRRGFRSRAQAATAIADPGRASPTAFGRKHRRRRSSRVETPFTRDPASVSLGARAAHLLAVEKSMHIAKNVIAAVRNDECVDDRKEFYSTTAVAILANAPAGGRRLRCDGDRP